MLIVETLVRKRRKHGEGNSHPLISEPVPDRTMAQTPHSGVALQLSRSRGAVHKPPHGVICSHKGWLQHFPAHFTSLKYYKGIPNSCPKLRLNLTFHFGCNFQTPQMFEKRTNIHTCLVLFFSLKFLPSLHLRTLLTITPDFI